MLLMLAGLSPRVRGNHTGLAKPPMIMRSIPACAGEPAQRVAVAVIVMVYPRVCGGTISAPDSWATSLGLSPRVRGNPLAKGDGVCGVRSIPACAGEPDYIISCTGRPSVYPRVCGGTSRAFAALLTRGGLSPRVRGNRRHS